MIEEIDIKDSELVGRLLELVNRIEDKPSEKTRLKIYRMMYAVSSDKLNIKGE